MIKKIDNIILLGTSHVAKQSQREIEKAIEEFSPEVIGIELDYLRLKSLLSKNKKEKKSYKLIKEIGVSGFLFATLAGFIQEKIGKSLGIEPGIDMKTAYLKSRENKIPVALIDQNIKITLKKLSNVSFFKKMSMFFSLIFKSFKKEYRKKLNFDVKKGVPDEKVIANMLEILKKEIPILYDILIEDRNKYMCEKLLKLKEKHSGNILAVVGAGHLMGMEKILSEKINFKKNENIDEIKVLENKNSYSFTFKIDTENN